MSTIPPLISPMISRTIDPAINSIPVAEDVRDALRVAIFTDVFCREKAAGRRYASKEALQDLSELGQQAREVLMNIKGLNFTDSRVKSGLQKIAALPRPIEELDTSYRFKGRLSRKATAAISKGARVANIACREALDADFADARERMSLSEGFFSRVVHEVVNHPSNKIIQQLCGHTGKFANLLRNNFPAAECFNIPLIRHLLSQKAPQAYELNADIPLRRLFRSLSPLLQSRSEAYETLAILPRALSQLNNVSLALHSKIPFRVDSLGPEWKIPGVAGEKLSATLENLRSSFHKWQDTAERIRDLRRGEFDGEQRLEIRQLKGEVHKCEISLRKGLQICGKSFLEVFNECGINTELSYPNSNAFVAEIAAKLRTYCELPSSECQDLTQFSLSFNRLERARFLVERLLAFDAGLSVTPQVLEQVQANLRLHERMVFGAAANLHVACLELIRISEDEGNSARPFIALLIHTINTYAEKLNEETCVRIANKNRDVYQDILATALEDFHKKFGFRLTEKPLPVAWSEVAFGLDLAQKELMENFMRALSSNLQELLNTSDDAAGFVIGELIFDVRKVDDNPETGKREYSKGNIEFSDFASLEGILPQYVIESCRGKSLTLEGLSKIYFHLPHGGQDFEFKKEKHIPFLLALLQHVQNGLKERVDILGKPVIIQCELQVARAGNAL